MEAVRAAAKIAPTKAGSAFDQASGLVIEIIPDTEDPTVAEALVRATDTTVFFSKWVPISSIEGGETVWRLPSMQFSQVVEKLRSVSGGTVTLTETVTQNGKHLDLASGRTRARFSLIAPDTYPNWDHVENLDFQDVASLGTAVKSVMWAADAKSIEWMGGVIIRGKYAMATNRYRIARYPLEIEGLDEDGITLPMVIAKVISEIKGDVKFYTDGQTAWFMPDDDTQIRTVLFADKPSRMLNKIFDVPHNNSVTFDSGDVISLVDLTGVINEGERGVNRLRMWIGRGELAAMSTNEEIGQLRDIVDLPNQANHPRTEIHIDAQNFALALTNGEGTKVAMHYSADLTYLNVPNGELQSRILKFTKDNGYAAWVVPWTGN